MPVKVDCKQFNRPQWLDSMDKKIFLRMRNKFSRKFEDITDNGAHKMSMSIHFESIVM
jgi:hypothetical protein